MKELQPHEIINVSNFERREEIFYYFLKKLLKFKKFRDFYGKNSYKEGLEFVDAIIAELNLSIEINEKELSKVPLKGSFITVSNFPLGGLEAIVLSKLISDRRTDYKIASTYKFHQIGPLNQITIPVNGEKNKSTYIDCTKNILRYLHEGHSIGIFPAGATATYNIETRKILDRDWNIKLIKLIKLANVPIIPVYFNDSFGNLFHILGSIHPVFQSLFIEKEFFKKKDSVINLRIGKPISPVVQASFYDIWHFSRFLRARTYALSANSKLDINKIFKSKQNIRNTNVEPIIPAISPEKITKQIEQAKPEHLLYSQRGFDIICVPSTLIPDVIIELGRLREITFREIGEGTNKSYDIDEYDLYYEHLIIWDNNEKKIVGAYRIGKGNEIIQKYSVKGFYLSSLFKIKKGLIPVLNETLEMGRSFIVKEYQRKLFSLFMLWKGILYLLLKNPQYRYLTGPVSISQRFSELTKNLIVNYFETYHSNKDLAKFVKPRKKYKVEVTEFDKGILLQDIGNNINKLDKYIKEIEPGASMPVLFKKYISLGAKTIAFNVDPKFNNCLDGLMILDIFDLPQDTLKVLAKDLEDDSLLERFKNKK